MTIENDSFAVVICTMDRPEPVRRAVASVLAGSLLPAEILVMDQSSDDRTEQAVRSMDEPRIRYCRLDFKNKSRASNEAALRTEAAFLAFTDDDCEVGREWLETTARAFEKNPNCAIVAGAILSGDKDPLPFTTSTDEAASYVVDSIESFYDLGICGGGNMAVRRTEFLALKGLDVAMGPGSRMAAAEDLDLFYRAIVSGRPVCKEPAAKIRHFSKALETRRERWRTARRYAAGTTAFHLKHFRCGDSIAGRRLYRYVLEHVRSNAAVLWGRRELSGLRTRVRSMCLIAAYPCWVSFYLLRYVRVPLSRVTRHYEAS